MAGFPCYAVLLLVAPDETVPRGYEGPSAVTLASPIPAEESAAIDPPRSDERAPVAESEADPRESQPAGSDEEALARDLEGELRRMQVTTNALGKSDQTEAFEHAGSRTVVEGETMRRAGASSVAEGLERTAGVRTGQGITGQGSGVGSLSLAVRGVNPRLSQRTTILFDEIPVAMAPYGQPQQGLFPLSLFSIERIDVVRGGASVRFGPRTGGGVFNLVPRPTPQVPTLSSFAQIDQFGEAQLGAGYGGTHRGVGVRVEYAPEVGRTFRDHSRFQLHHGLVAVEVPLAPALTLGSTTHGGWEESDLPGGLTPPQYEDDPFQALLPDGDPRVRDDRDGWRVGESLKLKWTPRDKHELQTIAYYTHTVRTTRLELADAGDLLIQPRVFDAMALEPRYTVRLEHAGGAFHDLAVGVRGAYELAGLERTRIEGVDTPMPTEREVRSQARLAAYSMFVDDELTLLDDLLRLSAGVRAEFIQMARRDPGQTLSRTDWALLPAASVWFGPLDQLALFAGYGRSFTPPDFVEMSQEDAAQSLVPELIDAVEGGIKLRDLVGIWGDVTPWFKNIQALRDVGEEAPERIGNARAWGVEIELGWEPGELWDIMAGSEISAGYGWMDSSIYETTTQAYFGKELPWYPAHEVWGEFTYAMPWGCSLTRRIRSPEDCRALTVGAGGEWVGRQFTEFTNSTVENGTGTAGPIPSYLLFDGFVAWQAILPGYWRLELTAGIKNVLDHRWYERSDDINGGRIAQRPRTFYVNLGLSHAFMRAWERHQRKKGGV